MRRKRKGVSKESNRRSNRKLLLLTFPTHLATVAAMPRTMRVEYPGAIYHIVDRGDRREDILINDVDRQDFLKTLAEGCQKTGWQVHAYCLMRNHFDLVLEPFPASQ